MTMRSLILASAILALAVPTAKAGGSDSNRVLAEMHQVRTGDYSYQVLHDGSTVPRYRIVGSASGKKTNSLSPFVGTRPSFLERRKVRDR